VEIGSDRNRFIEPHSLPGDAVGIKHSHRFASVRSSLLVSTPSAASIDSTADRSYSPNSSTALAAPAQAPYKREPTERTQDVAKVAMGWYNADTVAFVVIGVMHQ
jgi:hypothetical protein